MSHLEQQPDRVTILRFSSPNRLSLRQMIPVVRVAQDLYTRSWLFSQGRFTDLERYTTTRDRALEQEAGMELHSRIDAENEEIRSSQGTTFELSVPVSNDPKVLTAVEQAIIKTIGQRPPAQ